MEEKQILLGMTPVEIQEVVEQLGLPKFTGKQLVDWIYMKRCATFEDMTNLSKSTRALLAEHYETGLKAPVKEQVRFPEEPLRGRNHEPSPQPARV